jgi:hypothetical protein
MKRAEFKKRLRQLNEVIARGVAYYSVWQQLVLRDPKAAPLSLDQMNALLGRFRGLFTPIAHALLDSAYLQFAKVLDNDPQTASLKVLLSAARKDATLVPDATSSDLKKLAAELRRDTALLEELKKRRNQYIAHVDANPIPLSPQSKSDFDAFVERVKAAFNTLSSAHDGNVYSWDQMMRRSERDTTDVMRILQEEMERERSEFDKRMQTIALDEIRKQESVMERPLDEGELRSVLQSFGLTDEQGRRALRKYSLSLRSVTSS